MRFKNMTFLMELILLMGIAFQLVLIIKGNSLLAQAAGDIQKLQEQHSVLEGKLLSVEKQIGESFLREEASAYRNHVELEELLTEVKKKDEAYFYELRGMVAKADQLNGLMAKITTAESPGDVITPEYEDDRARALHALEINPHDLAALHDIGRIAYEGEDYHSAEDYYVRIAALDPSDREAYQVLYRIMYSLGRYEESIRYCRELLEIEITPQAMTSLARSQRMAGDGDGCLRSVGEALGMDPEYVPALIIGGEIAYERGDYIESYNKYQLINDLKEDGDTLVILGDLLEKMGKREDSLTAWERALKLNPGNTRQDQIDKLSLLERMASSAYELQDDRRIAGYLYKADDLGGSEEVYILYLRRLKDRGRTSDLLESITDFNDKFPRSKYDEEVAVLKRWAKGV